MICYLCQMGIRLLLLVYQFLLLRNQHLSIDRVERFVCIQLALNKSSRIGDINIAFMSSIESSVLLVGYTTLSIHYSFRLMMHKLRTKYSQIRVLQTMNITSSFYLLIEIFLHVWQLLYTAHMLQSRFSRTYPGRVHELDQTGSTAHFIDPIRNNPRFSSHDSHQKIWISSKTFSHLRHFQLELRLTSLITPITMS